MKKIKIEVVPLNIPNSTELNIVHVATSYVISTSTDFTDTGSVVASNSYDETNLYTWTAEVDVDNNTVLYARVKCHLTKGGQAIETSWSRIILFNSGQSGIKLSDSILVTPDVTVTQDFTEETITIETSDMIMYVGPGSHAYSSYRIVDTDNAVLFEKEYDDEALVKYERTDTLEKGKIYSIEAKHTNNTNNDSNYGKKLLFNYSPELNLIKLNTYENMVINRKFYYRVFANTINFETYDIEVRDDSGNIIISLTKQSEMSGYFLLDKERFTVYGYYNWYIKLNFSDGTSSEWSLEYTDYVRENTLINYDNSLDYPNVYISGNDLFTDGISCTSIRETFDNKIIMTDYFTNSLYLYKNYSGEIRKLTDVVSFDSSSYIDIDYVNIVQLPNHDILVDVVLYDENHQATTYFIKYEYDPVKLTLTELGRLARDDERYSTAMNNSLVVLDNGDVYYIPGRLVNDRESSSEAIGLKLRKLDTESMTITAEYNLPVGGTFYNAGLFSDQSGNIYTLGGSYSEYLTSTNEKYWKLDNKHIFRFNKSDSSWTDVGDFGDNVPDEVYCLHAFLRRDNKIIIFNSTHTGDGVSNFSKFIIFNPSTYAIEYVDIDGSIEVAVRNTIVFQSGNILRISSNTVDPQKTFFYPVSAKYVSDNTSIGIVNTEVTDLVVPDGSTVNIEDIYKYNSITIEGSGVLKWYRAQGITYLYSTDLIVNKSMTISDSITTNGGYHKILILDGITLTVESTLEGDSGDTTDDTTETTETIEITE